MKTPKIFKLKIETSLLVYCEEDQLYEFTEDVRSNSGKLLVSLPILSKEVVDISEFVEIKQGYSGDFFLEDQEFQNGIICKLESASGSDSKIQYSFKLVDEKEAMSDGKDFEFGDSFLELDLGTVKFPVNDSLHWWHEVENVNKILRRFGKILRKPSTFPIIKDFEPDNLRKKCKLVNDIYHSFYNGLENESKDIQNRFNYYVLRYPDLIKTFETMKKNDVY